jgi:hypothetical protein
MTPRGLPTSRSLFGGGMNPSSSLMALACHLSRNAYFHQQTRNSNQRLTNGPYGDKARGF